MKNIRQNIVAVWFVLSIALLGLEPDNQHLWVYIPIMTNFIISAIFVGKNKLNDQPCK